MSDLQWVPRNPRLCFAMSTAEAIDLDISSDMFESFPRLRQIVTHDLSHVLAPVMY